MVLIVHAINIIADQAFTMGVRRRSRHAGRGRRRSPHTLHSKILVSKRIRFSVPLPMTMAVGATDVAHRAMLRNCSRSGAVADCQCFFRRSRHFDPVSSSLLASFSTLGCSPSSIFLGAIKTTEIYLKKVDNDLSASMMLLEKRDTQGAHKQKRD